MPTHRPQVLAGVTFAALLASFTPILAQPPEKPTVPLRNPVNRGGGEDTLPLLPLALDKWLEQSGGPTRLKLKMDNATALEIAEEVERQTGLEIVLAPGLLEAEQGRAQAQEGRAEEPPRFSIEARGEGFWKDIANWGRGENRLSLGREWGTRGRWMLRRGANLNFGVAGLEAQAGPMRMLANSIQISRIRALTLRPRAAVNNVDNRDNAPAAANNDNAPAGQRQRDSLSIQTHFWLDPRLENSARDVLIEVSEARDDKNRIVAPFGEGYTSPQPLRDGGYGSLSLAAPEEDARILTSVKGVVRLSVVAKSETWEADLKAAPPVEKTFVTEDSELSIQLERITREGNNWSASLRLARKMNGPRRVFKPRKASWQFFYGGSSDYNLIARAARFVDAQGTPLTFSGGGSNGGGEANGVQISTVRLSLSRARARPGAANPGAEAEPNQGEPVKMILEVPTQMREVEVPFALLDVPLP